MNYKVNFDEILARLKTFKGFSANKEVAGLFGLSEPDFSRRKRKGTLLPLIITWALENRVNMDWLLTGRSNIQNEPVFSGRVSEAAAGYGRLNADLLKDILEAVEIGLDQKKVTLAPGKKAQAAALLYELYLGAEKQIDNTTVGRYLDLVTGDIASR